MSLPIHALSDEELEVYAGIHPEAAEELAQRIAKGIFAKDDRAAELESELRAAVNEADEADDRFNSLHDQAQHSVDQLKELLGAEMPPQEKHDALLKVVAKLESVL